ncbi:serine/threonine-protein kinase [Nocardia aurantiaca]|uniref:Uncharacterized protein n=1 Tax=Nocardia aurantiaca TaxID=2675850 RepID=A0A6I3L0T6_9NOCA|nr:hypothetical protein [Nocardia aurantiaca]
MTESPDALEARLTELRAAVRRAMSSGDRASARQLRARLRQTEIDWETAVLGVAPEPEPVAAPAVPVREHVHRVLALLTVPAAPRLILAVHDGFFSGELLPARLTSLRRDEERSFRTAPFARPYYVCAALTVDLLAPARGLMALSTWSAQQRLIGPLSARVDLLTAVIRLAEHTSELAEPTPAVQRVLRQLAATIPGARTSGWEADPGAIIEAAGNELDVHRDSDARQRSQAAERLAGQVDEPAARLFGTRFGLAGNQRHGSSAG